MNAPAQDWHDARKRVVGGSEVVALLGSDEGFVTEWELYHAKRGTMPPREPTPAMKLGTVLEPAIIEATRQLLGWYPTPWADVQIGPCYLPLAPGVSWTSTERGPLLRHESGLGGTPDGLVVVDGVLCLLEIKHASSWALRDWPGDGEELPTGYLCQVWTYLGLLGLDEARVAVLCDGELRTFTVEAQPRVFAMLCDETRRFWARVEAGDEPKPNPSRDAAAIVRRWRATPKAGAVDWSDSPALCAMVAEYSAARDSRLSAEKVEEARKAMLLHRMGSAERVIAGPYSVSTAGNVLRVKEHK